MYTVGRIGSYITRGVYTVSGSFHPFGGAVDIIVVEQPDGSSKSSPWYVRFGKFQGVLKTKKKIVSIAVNGVEADFQMYLDHKGEAYFLKEGDVEEGESLHYSSSSSDETDGQSDSSRRSMKSKICNYESDKLNSADQSDASHKKVVASPGSRLAKLPGFVFIRKSAKDNVYKEGEGDANQSKSSSLERAESATDLLEVKWSTNLAAGKSRRDNSTRFSAIDILGDKVVEHLEVKDDKILGESSVNDDRKNRPDDSVSDKETVSLNELMDGCPFSGSENLETSTVETSTEISCIDTVEQVVEASLLGENTVEANCLVVSDISRTADNFGVGNADKACSDSLIECEIEECHRKLSDEEQACDVERPLNPACRVSEGSGSDTVQSSVYSETSQGSIIGLDNSYNQARETLYLTSGGGEEVRATDETVHVTTELLSKEKHIDPEKELAEVSDEDIVNPIVMPQSYPDVVSVDPALCSTKEIDATLTVSSEVQNGLNITDDVDQSLGIGDSKRNYSEIVMDKAGSDLPVKSLEEEQFLFSDLDEFKVSEVQCIDSGFAACLMKDNHLACCGEGIKTVNSLVDGNDYPCSSSYSFPQHSPSTDLENSLEKSRVKSSPISFSGSDKAVEEVGLLAESLPNMWSPIIDLSADACHFPASHSLDFDSEPLNWTLLKEIDSDSIKSDADKEQLAQEQPNVDNSQELKSVLSSPTVGDPSKTNVYPGGSWSLWPFSLKRSKPSKPTQPAQSDTKGSDAAVASDSINGMNEANNVCQPKMAKKMVKAITPSSKQLASLNLKEGRNTVTFTFSTAMLGKQQVDARIYLWKWNTRIVISDVDGTITK